MIDNYWLEFWVLSAIFGALLVIAVIFYWFKTFGFNNFKQQFKRTIFLFKWFIIGKYHCSVTDKQKRFFSFLNKAFWGGFVIGWCLFIAQIIKILGF